MSLKSMAASIKSVWVWLSLGMGTSAFCQIGAPPQDGAAWHGTRPVAISAHWDKVQAIRILGDKKERVISPPQIPATTEDVRSRIRGMHFWDGVAYASHAYREKGKAAEIRFWHSTDLGKSWSILGTYVHPKGHPSSPTMFYPTEKPGVYWGFCGFDGAIVDKRASMLGLFKLFEGRFSLMDVVTLKVGEDDVFLSEALPNTQRVNLHPRWACLSSTRTNMPVPFEGGLALVASEVGLIWILDGKSGQVRHLVRLYPELDDKRLQSDFFPVYGLMGCRPLPDGDLVVAKRSSLAFRKASTMVMSKEGFPDTEAMTRTSLEADDAVEWVRIHTQTGEIATYQRPGGLKKLSSSRALWTFAFRLDAQGRIQQEERNE